MDEFSFFNDDLESFNLDFFGNDSNIILPNNAFWIPNSDIYENEKEIVILLEVAGIKKEEIQIQYDHGVLSISGNREDVDSCSKLYFHSMEINLGPFRKDIILPQKIEPHEIQIHYHDGILKILCKKNVSDTNNIFKVEII